MVVAREEVGLVGVELAVAVVVAVVEFREVALSTDTGDADGGVAVCPSGRRATSHGSWARRCDWRAALARFGRGPRKRRGDGGGGRESKKRAAAGIYLKFYRLRGHGIHPPCMVPR